MHAILSWLSLSCLAFWQSGLTPWNPGVFHMGVNFLMFLTENLIPIPDIQDGADYHLFLFHGKSGLALAICGRKPSLFGLGIRQPPNR